MNSRLTLLALLFMTSSSACGLPPSQAPPPSGAVEGAEGPADDALPPSSPTYATEPTGGVLLGGPLSAAAERQLSKALWSRGDRPVGDGRLAQVALWFGQRAWREGSPPEPSLTDAVARRAGYVGPTPWIVLYPRSADPEAPIADGDMAKTLAALPQNVPITGYGIATLTRGGQKALAVALSFMELTLKPIPKVLAVNDKLRLSGKVGDRFATAHLAVTFPGGKARTWDSASRDVTGEWRMPWAGEYRIEVLGDGASGPVVEANFPLYVGMTEPALAMPPARDTPVGPEPKAGAAAAVDASVLEATMRTLLNQARADAHLRPVQVDEALAAAARAHSADMASHGFFGHVSPTTGTTEARLRAEHLLYSQNGENIVRSDSAQHAHDSLMASPAHREAMLGADYTHVGIGVVLGDDDKGANVYATLEFAREAGVTLEDVPRHVLEATDLARMPHLLPRLALDAALSRSAESGVAVLASDPNATGRALDAAKKAATRERPPAAMCFLLLKSVDVTRLDPPAPAKDTWAARLGVAAMRNPQGPDTFDIVLVVEAAPGRGLACE